MVARDVQATSARVRRVAKAGRAGFTLIELLVVIAIIGMLASIILASLNSARVKARDAKRFSDIRQFQTALDVYYNDNGHYPYTKCSSGYNWTSFDSPFYSPKEVCSTLNGSGVTLTAFMAPYIGQLKDPLSAVGDAGYLYINRGDGPYDYCILFWRTPENLNTFGSAFVPSNRCSAWDSNGKCTSAPNGTSGTNAIYIGSGLYANGC